MKVEFIYLRSALALILTFVILFGIVPDALNIHPLLGFIAIVIVPLLDFWLLKPIFKKTKKIDK